MKKLVLAIVLSVLFTGSFAQNNSLEFDGIDDYVASASNPNLNMYASSFTVECWIWGDNALSYSGERIIIEYGYGWQIGTYHIASVSDNHLRVTFEGRSSANGAEVSDLDWTDGKWHHIAGVFNQPDNYIKLYFDGVEVASAVEYYFPNAADAPLYIGSRKGTENFSQIKMDEIRIWNVARTPTEIRHNMYHELTNPASETNLKAYYKLNETSGTTAADSKNSYNGTLGNYGSQTGYWQTSPAMFGPKNALDFDGINEHVFISSLSSTFTQGTISFWIRLTATPSTNSRIFSDAWDDNEIILTSGEGKLSTLNMISGDELVSSNALPISEWTHVAITMDNSVSKLYINGVLDDESGPASVSITDIIRLGGQFTAYWEVLNGQLEEFRIWSVVRSEQEIRDYMCRSLTGNEAGLLVYFSFDNSTGTTLPDFSANNNYGTLTNMEITDWVSSTAFNTWLNTTSTTWTESTNWSAGAVPNSSTSNVGIPHHGTDPIISANITTNNLVVGENVTLTFSSGENHTIHGSYFNIGTTNLEANNELTITGSLYVLEGSTVNIKPLAYMTVDENLDLDFLLGSGTLNIKSDATGSGSLIVKGSVDGSVNTERYIEAANWGTWDDGWHFLSSPVAAQAINSGGFTTAPYDFYCWYELTNEWINFKNQSTTPPYWTTANTISNGLSNNTANFLVGKGYMAAYDEEGTKSFSGSLNVADVAISGLEITASGANRSWHLLGNPYSSGLTWDATWTKTNIAGTIQIWNESGQSYSSIAADPGGTIPATNGFMVQVESETGSLTIPHGKCTHGGSFYKASSFPIIKLKAVNQDFPAFQETQLLFNPASTQGYEMEYDGDFLAGYAPYFYSEIEGEPMAVNSMPDLTESTSIPLAFIKNDGVNFSIEMYETELVPFDIWLLDTKTNQDQNLSNNPAYLFTAMEGDNPNRFFLHFQAVGMDEPTTSWQSLPIVVWNHENTLTVSNPEQLTGTLEVINITGQTALMANLENVTKQTIPHQLKAGLYVVQVSAAGKWKTQKIIVEATP